MVVYVCVLYGARRIGSLQKHLHKNNEGEICPSWLENLKIYIIRFSLVFLYFCFFIFVFFSAFSFFPSLLYFLKSLDVFDFLFHWGPNQSKLVIWMIYSRTLIFRIGISIWFRCSFLLAEPSQGTWTTPALNMAIQDENFQVNPGSWPSHHFSRSLQGYWSRTTETHQILLLSLLLLFFVE